MNGVAHTIQALYEGEQALERQLAAAAVRHGGDHGIHQAATDLARWSHDHRVRLARTGRLYGLDLPAPRGDGGPPVRRLVRDRAARTRARRPATGTRLLDDLLELHLAATRTSLRWDMLAQAAQAAHDERLLELVITCRPRTLRQIQWTRTLLKELSPRLLTTEQALPVSCDGFGQLGPEPHRP
ncbi:hypothetical protein [Streptomyces sp. enrichment culture]|uniref:hypothetical protein n=1 Tax=Streptomyces sp. enrichment culture TaxID=1795815 RepID=UPI003F57DD4F